MRRSGFLSICLIVSLLCLIPGAALAQETLLLQQPTVSQDHVVFVYANDLWIVGREGGDARRLTSDSGTETSPRFSPDGQTIAYSGQYEGNTDVYTISIDGGVPKRLTWHPGGEGVQDWHPNGLSVLFGSGRQSLAPVGTSFLVSKDGGTPEGLPMPRVSRASYHSSGNTIAYTPYPDPFRTWKRYRGGLVSRIWIYDTKTHDVEVVPHVNASDTFPSWIGDDLYFASDRDQQMNIWKYRPGSGKPPTQITFFNDYDVQSMSSGAGALALSQAGAIHLYDPVLNRLTRLKIRVRSDGLHGRPRWQTVQGHVRGADISPNGKRAVFEARGEIITVPKENGDTRNLTRSSGAHDRDPAWSPDGKSVAWFSDASGEYQLMVSDRLGREEPKAYDLGGGGFYHDARWSPDGKHILFRDKTNRTAFVTLESGELTTVVRNSGSLGVVPTQAAWSPDSQWIAFELKNERTLYDRIALFSVKDGTSTVVTDAFGEAGNPAFSSKGEYLYFTASVDIGPKLFGLDMMSSASRNGRSSLYVAVLKSDAKNPLDPKSDEGYDESKDKEKKKKEDEDEDDKEKDDEEKDGDEPDDSSDDAEPQAEDEETDGEKPASPEDKDEDKKDEEKKEPAKPSIDLQGLDQRILALPIPSGIYGQLGSAGKTLLFVERSLGGPPAIKSFDFDSRKVKTVAEGAGGFQVSGDGKSLLTSSRGSFQIMSATGGKKKTLNINSVKVRVEPAKEWPQLLREAWRFERDYFYDPQMHGVDWDAMWKRWSVFLPHVRHRSDLSLLIGELIGELACGHNYVAGGETPSRATGVSVGLLGADYEKHEGRFRIKTIYRGQNWSGRSRSPLTVPGVDVKAGDYLISVNGREITASENLYAAFENTAGNQIDLGVSETSDGSKVRFSKVVPVGNEGALRRMAWVEGNRRRVAELSGGRLAYIYMPNTAGAGMASFDRDYYSQLDKSGLILDERFNGGGKVADYIINVLSRKRLCYWMNREQWVAQSPFGIFDGPKVMVINERAGSGGDAMPWMFSNAGVGPLVGRRTWGGLVGISGYPPLMDGGMVTAASFGVMDVDGNWAVENEGVAPDYEVTQWPKDVIAGGDPQLEKAVEVALRLLEKQPKKSRPSYKPPAVR